MLLHGTRRCPVGPLVYLLLAPFGVGAQTCALLLYFLGSHFYLLPFCLRRKYILRSRRCCGRLMSCLSDCSRR
ncbi:uncharacterized protein BDZ99DRAFT_308939 [Mytilinidion resinicola]|uniref:Uncharacterized protein n=1 Tax=Mytilinidion resinicola TaxID=574789 RepID=A0A6A6YQK5_9PEZI|nr:uncharacterized protein BDZ99DRAFT_308939 [Mytilinidion resinicola]KAF2810294.1 hypothetical protein BDZ99DRAFT_308939 [Mytilinidion resinicola]